MTSGNGLSSKVSEVERWKWISGILASVLTSGMACWLTFGGVTKEYVQNNSPYVYDKQAIWSNINDLKKHYAVQADAYKEMLDLLHKIEIDVAKLSASEDGK